MKRIVFYVLFCLQIVDEKLWNSEDEDDKGKEEGKDKKEEQYDDRGAISVDDKKDLDYEVRH